MRNGRRACSSRSRKSVPQGLKPGGLAGLNVRAEARTLQLEAEPLKPQPCTLNQHGVCSPLAREGIIGHDGYSASN